MANLTFADTHNMVAYLSKSDASARFDLIVDFFNAQMIQYALIVNPAIYVSCIKQFWATTSIKKVTDVVKLQAFIDRKKLVVTEDIIRQDLQLDDADGVDCLPTEEIFTELARMGYEKPPPKLTFYKAMVRNVDSPSKFLMYPRFLQVLISNQVDDLSSHTTKYTSPALTQKGFANMRRIGKGFLEVETPLFATMLVQPQAAAEEEEDEADEVPAALTPPSPTHEPTPPLQEPITSPPQAQPAPSSSPPQEQLTTTFTSDMTLLNTLLETCTTLSHKVAALEQDKVAQALEIYKLKRRVKRLEKKRRSKHSNFKRLRKVGRKEDDNAAIKEVNAAEPTMFNDEEVTMTMAQTLIKMKAEKARLLDEQMAKRLHDEEVEQAAAREKQENDDLEKAKVLQQQYDQKQENIDWNVVAEQMQEKPFDNIRKYQSLKRKPISVAQARKNMIVYLMNMAGYKMTHFKGMTYDQKRVAKEKLLQESFKKLRAEVEVSVSEFKVEALQVKYPLIDREIHSEGSRSYWKIIRVGGITQAYQSFEDMLKDFDKEDLDALWRLVKERFSTTVPTVDKEKALWVELKRLFEPDYLQQLEGMTYMLAEKDYPLSNGVMTLMLSARLQVEEDSEMERDLVIKIFIKASQPKRKSLDTSSKQNDTAAKETEGITLRKPPYSSGSKLYSVTHLPKSKVLPKVGESNALSKPITSNSTPSSRESIVVNNERVIAPGIFRINPFIASKVDNFVPNKHVKANVRTKPITVAQPHVITKNDVNSKINGFSPKDVKSTTRTRRPQPRNNPKSDKVPFKSKSSCLSNKLDKIEENHRSLQSSNYPDNTSSECNNIKLAIRNEKSEVICATCKQCLITANHDECVLQYVNDMKSSKKNQSANVSNVENQKKHKPKVKKPKKVRSKEILASPKPSTPRTCLR
uniref:Xylulose kinase-1 n=1 Tax=Tanacetum cinerariifolium TaxID=118510 RepID=A0A699GRQ7_TANCI|nr:hypothetical protein [Tanacetum cinerariifolium]